MSVRTDTVNLIVNVNGDQSREKLNQLKKSAADIKFEMLGLKKGTEEYIAKAKELSQVDSEMDALKKSIGITSLTQKELIAELNKLKALRGSVTPFTKEYKDFDDQIKKVESRLYDVRNGVQGFASFFSKIGDEVKQFGVLAAGYLGFQFITTQFTNIIKGAGKLSDQLADLRRVAGLTSEEATALNNSLKKIDTRTSVEGLRDIAIIAGKLGVAKDDIFGFTKAVDQLVVSLGDELGDADQITTQLGKILNVFDGKVDGDNITKLGNAFVELANTGAATGGFIADFDQRLSGIAKSAGISLGALSGLGAGLEEMGGRVESSATAIQKLVISISSDIPAAAKIAGQSTEEFTKLFKLDPTEALLKYSQGLVKNKDSFAAVTASLKDAGEEGTRTIETITKLGTGADHLRERIDLGKQSIEENTAITEAFRLKNEDFGATLDKVGKEFNALVSSPAVTNFLKGAVEGAETFIKAIIRIPAYIKENSGAFTLLLYGIVLLNGAYIKAAAVTIRDTAAKLFNASSTRISAIATNIAVAAQAAYITVTNLLTGRITIATAAQRLWNIAIGSSTGGLGILLIVIGTLAAAFNTLATGADRAATKSKLYAEVQKRVVDSTTDQLSKIDLLNKVLNDNNVSYDNKKKALEALIALNPKYLGGLTLENIKTAEGQELLTKYINSLKLKAELEAKSALLTDKLKDRDNTRASVKAVPEFANFNDDQVDNVIDKGSDKLKGKQLFAFLKLKLDGVDFDKFKQTTKEIAILQDDLTKEAKKNVDSVLQTTNTVGAATVNTIAALKAKIKEYDDAFELIDVTNKKAIASNRANRKELQDQLDALEGKKTPEQKKGESEYKRLLREAKEFYKQIKELQERTNGGASEQDQEVIKAKQKYKELLDKAANFYAKHLTDEKQNAEEVKIINEALQKDLDGIRKKYQAEQDSKFYENGLAETKEYYDKQKIVVAQEYAQGKLNKQQYEQQLTIIEKDQTADRITIAKFYSGTVKKAATDLKDFEKKNEEAITANMVKQAEARAALAVDNKSAGLRTNVLKTRPGTKENLDAKKAELDNEEQLEIQALKEKNEALGICEEDYQNQILEKQAEFHQKQKDLDDEYTRSQIDQVKQYAEYFITALDGLNRIATNKENAQFNKEKSLNDKKRKELKKELDHKLLSQGQYDKAMQKLKDEEDKKDLELKRKQAKREKALNIFRAIVNVAAGVATSLSYGGPVGIALAAITAVLGAIEIATIASEPLPTAGKGKYLDQGDKHSDKSGGIPIMAERGEAIINAKTMDDTKVYSLTGTPKQITSRLNSQNGGVNWAGGAVVNMAKWVAAKPSRISNDVPKIMARGGYLPPTDPVDAKQQANRSAQSNNDETDSNALLRELINEQRQHTEELRNMKTRLHAVVSIKEYREKEKQYDTSKKASGFNG